MTVVPTKRDLIKFVVGDVNKTRGDNGNQGQQELIMQICTSGGRPRHRFVRCLRSLMLSRALAVKHKSKSGCLYDQNPFVSGPTNSFKILY